MEPVEGMHRAIARRWFNAVGPVAKPVRLLHDATSSLVYGSIRLGATVLSVGIDASVALESRATDAIQASTNGLWGDQLGRHETRLGLSMGIRNRDGGLVTPGSQLASAFPDATGHLVVLVHGLFLTERCWAGDESNAGIIGALDDHPALTPVAVRYNTGLRVPTNGAKLASLLQEIVMSWPVPVESISLVGHSMGGLVIRSACESALGSGHAWIDLVRDVVTLGSPHRGAPVEKIVNVASWALSFASETRPLADLLNRRSAGIKDLRFGAIGEDDWGDVDPDALLRDTVGEHPLLPGIAHHFVAGVFTSDPAHPAGVLMGDFMVRAASGTGRDRLEPANVVVLGGVRHADILHQDPVIERVLGWLSPPV